MIPSIAVAAGLAVMIVITIAIIAALLAPRMVDRTVVYDVEPDKPCAFGYKMSWIAIKSTDTERIISALDLHQMVPTNWQSGIGTVYHEELGENRIFVSPPVQGWTFVVGLALPQPMNDRFVDKWTPLMEALAADFDEFQYYFSYPLIDYYAWGRVLRGRLSRAFAMGDEGVLMKRGRTSVAEKALGLTMFELRGVSDFEGGAGGEMVLYPTETHVMQLAGQWSIDPTKLADMNIEPGLGSIGQAPAYWRPERMRLAA